MKLWQRSDERYRRTHNARPSSGFMKRCDRLSMRSMTEEPSTPKAVEVSMSMQNPQHSLSRASFPKSERKDHPGTRVAGRTDAQRNISVSVIVKRKNPLDLEKIIGQHLSQEEVLEKYAAAPANFDQLRDFAHKHGLTGRRRRNQPGAAHDGPAWAGQ